jgi:hypothetical protein
VRAQRIAVDRVAESALQGTFRHLVADTRAYILQLEGYARELQAADETGAEAVAVAAIVRMLLDSDSAIGLRRLNELATEALRKS